MISLKGVLCGLGLSIAGTIVYLVLMMRSIASSAPQEQGEVGIDLIALFRNSLLHSPTYWLLILVMLALGCAIVYFWHRPTV